MKREKQEDERGETRKDKRRRREDETIKEKKQEDERGETRKDKRRRREDQR